MNKIVKIIIAQLFAITAFSQIDRQFVESEIKSRYSNLTNSSYLSSGFDSNEVKIQVIANRKKHRISFTNDSLYCIISNNSIQWQGDVQELTCPMNKISKVSDPNDDSGSILVYYDIECDTKFVWQLYRISEGYVTFLRLDYNNARSERINKPKKTSVFIGKIIE